MRVRAFITLLLVAGLSSPVLAAPIPYGDFVGVTVTYTAVTEEALTSGDGPALFGAPTLSGDSLDFNPSGFAANATGSGGLDQTDGELTFGIQAKPTKIISTVEFSEAGEFDLIAAFGFESNEAFASVTATIFVDVLEVDGVGIGTLNGTFNMAFSEGGDWLLSTDFDTAIPKHAFGDWTGALSIDINQMLLDNSIVFNEGATKVAITLDNRLTAVSAEGTTAFIAKKDFDGLTITATPEPGALVLLAIGLAVLSGARRRAA